jgi:hypothetical protein
MREVRVAELLVPPDLLLVKELNLEPKFCLKNFSVGPITVGYGECVLARFVHSVMMHWVIRFPYHAGADDADFALDAAPETNVGVVVCRVGDLADSRRVLEAHHTAGRHEQAYQECQDDAGFASLVLDLDLHEFRDREEEDDQVEEDVDAAVDVDGQLEVVAVAVVFSVPLVPKITFLDKSVFYFHVESLQQLT